MPHERFDFCATLEPGGDRRAGTTFFGNGLLRMRDHKNRCIKASVFIDIRELGQQIEQPTFILPRVVWLHSLDECKRLIGECVSHTTVKFAPGDRRTGITIGELGNQRELTVSLPSGLEQTFPVVPLDKLEEQVIQGAPELIHHFTENDGQPDWRLFGDFQFLLAIRIGENTIRFTPKVLGAAVIERVTLSYYPYDFIPRDIDSLGNSPS